MLLFRCDLIAVRSLAENPIGTLSESMFSTFPELVQVFLGDNVKLTSCCGLEFLISNSRFVFVPNTITCTLDGETVLLNNISKPVFCPCVGKHLPNAATVQPFHGTTVFNGQVPAVGGVGEGLFWCDVFVFV
eukprot:m.277358 g.277358  ORF g.277358 m.277358 type:complete len:132 (+) comp19374_c1_seq8:194-589(+)